MQLSSSSFLFFYLPEFAMNVLLGRFERCSSTQPTSLWTNRLLHYKHAWQHLISCVRLIWNENKFVKSDIFFSFTKLTIRAFQISAILLLLSVQVDYSVQRQITQFSYARIIETLYWGCPMLFDQDIRFVGDRRCPSIHLTSAYPVTMFAVIISVLLLLLQYYPANISCVIGTPRAHLYRTFYVHYTPTHRSIATTSTKYRPQLKDASSNEIYGDGVRYRQQPYRQHVNKQWPLTLHHNSTFRNISVLLSSSDLVSYLHSASDELSLHPNIPLSAEQQQAKSIISSDRNGNWPNYYMPFTNANGDVPAHNGGKISEVQSTLLNGNTMPMFYSSLSSFSAVKPNPSSSASSISHDGNDNLSQRFSFDTWSITTIELAIRLVGAFFCILIILVTIVGNVLVIIVVARFHRMRTVTNILLARWVSSVYKKTLTKSPPIWLKRTQTPKEHYQSPHIGTQFQLVWPSSNNETVIVPKQTKKNAYLSIHFRHLMIMISWLKVHFSFSKQNTLISSVCHNKLQRERIEN